MAGSVRGWRGIIVAGAFGAVTFVGTIYGAGLKTQQDYQTEKKRVVELSVDEKVAIIDERRKTLVTQQEYLQGKLNKLHARMAKTEDGGGGR